MKGPRTHRLAARQSYGVLAAGVVSALCLFGATNASAGTRNLGFGFRTVVLAESNPPGVFESVGYFEYLYYRNIRLARSDRCSVAPDGHAIVYQEAGSGDIFLFERQGRKTLQLTQKFPGLANRFAWHDGDKYVSVFVVPSSTSKVPGRWIKLPIK